MCTPDHQAVHKGEIVIDGYIDGSEGRRLVWNKVSVEMERKRRLKYGEEEVAEFMKMKPMIETTTMKNILLSLKTRGYKVSAGTLKKIWNGEYGV